jgi:phosphohistidine phosphatase
MIELFLIRHGIAAERGTYSTDEERPLTDEGIRKTRQVAKRLRELNLRFDLILSSPLVRAKQTAELLLDVSLSKQLQFSETLAPDGDLQAWIDWLQTCQQGENAAIALVGHQPNLGQWAEILVWGHTQEHLIVKKAGIIGLNVPEITDPRGHCQLFWLTAPKLLL